MKKSLLALLIICAVLSAGCGEKKAKILTVGVVPGPQAEIVAHIREQAAAEGFLFATELFDPFEFAENYIKINAALKEGLIDVNCFQNYIYINEANQKMSAGLTALGACYLNPLSLYSPKGRSLDSLPPGALVLLPDAPEGRGRALALLEKAGLLTLRAAALPDFPDIVDNPRGLVLETCDLPRFRSLGSEAALVACGYEVAKELGFPLAKALEKEAFPSPFAQVIAARAVDAGRADIARFVGYYRSPETKRFIQEKYPHLLPAW